MHEKSLRVLAANPTNVEAFWEGSSKKSQRDTRLARVPLICFLNMEHCYADSVLSLMLLVHALSSVVGVVIARTRK